MNRGNRRSLRGGSWLDIPAGARAAYRDWNLPVDRGRAVGFRVLQEEEGSSGPRTLRGGSWLDIPAYTHAAYRHRRDPDRRSVTVGFRVLQEGPRDE
jgi:formylglycine-generating enzyme required for sulfatase activity